MKVDTGSSGVGSDGGAGGGAIASAGIADDGGVPIAPARGVKGVSVTGTPSGKGGGKGGGYICGVAPKASALVGRSCNTCNN